MSASRFMWSIAVLACLTGTVVTPSRLIAQAENHHEKVQPIIDAYLTAVGGEEALMQVKTKQMEYMVHMINQPSYHVSQSVRQGGEMISQREGMDRYTLVLANQGWNIGPDGTGRLPAEAVASLSRMADLQGPFINSEAKGIHIDYAGQDRFEFTDLECLKVFYADSTSEVWCFDTRSHLPMVVKKPSIRLLNGQIVAGPLTWHFYYDFRLVNGVRFPHVWAQSDAELDHMHVFTVEDLQINGPVDETKFTAPAQ